jgi:hypothetical protein
MALICGMMIQRRLLRDKDKLKSFLSHRELVAFGFERLLFLCKGLRLNSRAIARKNPHYTFSRR